jgi:hypothetical protein
MCVGWMRSRYFVVSDAASHTTSKRDGCDSSATVDVGSQHQYPGSVLLKDILGGVAGLLVCAALIVLGQPSIWSALILYGFVGLFAYYVLRILVRSRCHIVMDSGGLSVYSSSGASDVRQRLGWAELERLDLNYYCTRRDGREGWLNLRLRGAGTSLSLDSRLSGFEQVLSNALDAARRRGVAISAATAANLVGIGLSVPVDVRGDDS